MYTYTCKGTSNNNLLPYCACNQQRVNNGSSDAGENAGQQLVKFQGSNNIPRWHNTTYLPWVWKTFR